ncbi:hypothetical protein CYJ73_24985 [Gordonia terrae]|uniref:Uncharacterized protein n=1 Tax=Gordonia terrae TaxID=2055 RepID=A0A2I1R138_9ACTN|nr:hypothetical protein [Gordonia terrae]PKZ62832.1 hypothetical protein CYJ73_24985 [Gordonia terrae]
MSRRRTNRIRAITGLINAQANLAGTQTRLAQIELDEKRFEDAVAQRDRYYPVVDEAVTAHEVQLFTYQQLVASAYPTYTPHRTENFDDQ